MDDLRSPLSGLAEGLSVVIPAFNEEDLIGSCVAGLRRQLETVSPPIAFEIIVCDNNSTDQTAAEAGRQGARVVFEPHNQIARARNTGARASIYPWLLFVDADSVPGPDLIAETVRLLRGGEVGAGGAVVKFDARTLRPFPAFMVRFWNGVSRWAGLAAGSYLFCRREDWLATGGFDETLYAGEELWFSHALKKCCRRARLRFVVLRSHHILTSARKLHWYGDHQLLSLLSLAMRPWRLKSREACHFWYNRPPKER
jgi:glycosyltransferase involved in cell wall biosynthesis